VKSRSSYLLLAVTAAVVLALDRITKILVREYLPLNVAWQPVRWLEPLFTFRRVHNTGAAFGLFPGFQVVFMAVAVVVIFGIIIYYRRLEHAPIILRLALGLQLGGAIGNLIDRIHPGYVIDFVDLGWWPVFNVADSCIVVGTVLLGWYLLFIESADVRRQGRQSEPETGC